MPLIKNQTAATKTDTITTTTTTATINEIDKTATTQSTHKNQPKINTANKIATTSETGKTTTNIITSLTTTANQSSKQQQKQPKQQKPIKDITTKRKKHYYITSNSSSKHRKHKISLAKSVPATPVQVNPLTTNHFVPSSPDFYDNEDDDDDDVLYMPPYSYPNCSLDILNDEYHLDNEYDFNAPQTQQQFKRQQIAEEEQHFRATLDGNYSFEQKQRNTEEEDHSSMAMVTPPPPYDTPYSKQQFSYSTAPHYSHPHQAAYSAPKAQRSNNTPHARKYIFNNNREQFNISSSNGNSSSNSIQQQPQSTSLGSTLTNAITPTKLSAAAAAMFAAPQMVQLNRKWSNLHRKRRRRNSSSGDSKELDKLVLQSVDWDENDIY